MSGLSGVVWKAGQYVVAVYLLIWVLGAAVELLVPLLPWLMAGVVVGVAGRVWWGHRRRW